MSEGYKIRSLSEIVNEILSTVRSYYDAEYAYYIEKDRGDIETIYEWCDENIEWQRDRMKLLPEERQPKSILRRLGIIACFFRSVKM